MAVCALVLGTSGCRRSSFPDVPDGYREFAYVSNGGSNTVSVLDLVYLRQDHTLQVGTNPTHLAANPVRNEVYVVNTQSGTVSVIDAETNRVAATIPVHRLPTFLSVDPTGHRAYVTNFGSNSVSVLDLDRRREIAVAGTGEQPSLARISPDGRSLVVTNRGSGSVSIFGVIPYNGAAKSEAVASSSCGISGLPRGFGCCDSSGFFEGLRRMFRRPSGNCDRACGGGWIVGRDAESCDDDRPYAGFA